MAKRYFVTNDKNVNQGANCEGSTGPNMFETARTINVAALCILLASCGGGGSNSGSGPNQMTASAETGSNNTGNTTGGTSQNTGSSANSNSPVSPSNSTDAGAGAGSAPPTSGGIAGGTPPSGSTSGTPPAGQPTGSTNNTTVPGNGDPAFAHDTTARFNSPDDLAVDQAGNVYVMDTGNRVVRRIAPTGDVASLPGTYDSLRPSLSTGAAGEVFVLDGASVYKASPLGNRTLVMTYPAEAGSVRPIDISADGSGRIYVLANYRTRFWVHQVDPDNPPRGTFWGDGAGPHRSVYSLNTFGSVTGIATDARGNLAVGTTGPVPGASDIRYVAASAQPVDDPSSTITRWMVQLSNPNIVFGRDGNLYVADADYTYANSNPVSVSNVRILRIAPDGTSTTIFSGFPDGSTNRQISSVKRFGIAAAANGDVYFADPYVHAVYRIGPAGRVSLIAGKEGEAGNAD